MSDEEDYASSEDEDYVPSEGEAVSEEENSGEEENLDALKEDGEPVKLGKRKRKTQKKPSGPRKRTGGIRLTGEELEDGGIGGQDLANKELEEQIKLEQEKKKEEQEKKKADDLWSSFMSDVGTRPKKPAPPKSSGLGALASLSKPIVSSPKPVASSASTSKDATQEGTSTPSSSTSAAAKSTITVTKVYDFAGEAVQVTKELDINSKEGKAELKRQEIEKEGVLDQSNVKASPVVGGGSVKKVTGAGLGSVLERINKKPKIGTLEKSKLDWEAFKQKEGINEELQIHNRGKQSYIERMNFLNRTDLRQFEIEKSLRQSSTSKR